MYPKETGQEDMGRIHLAQDKAQWRALVNTVLYLRVSKHSENFLINEQLLASLEGLSSMEVVPYVRQDILLFSTASRPTLGHTQPPI
jgi:hypothetical protein